MYYIYSVRTVRLTEMKNIDLFSNITVGSNLPVSVFVSLPQKKNQVPFLFPNLLEKRIAMCIDHQISPSLGILIVKLPRMVIF